MTNPVFPTLSVQSNSSAHAPTQENPAIATKLEGGYVATRPRHTRTPRRTFPVSYTDLRDADKQLLMAFWDTVKGGSVIFDWTDPESAMNAGVAKTYQVRFTDQELKWAYKGRGPTKLWDISFTLQQA